MARKIFRLLHQANQAICLLNWKVEKLYENEKAKRIFSDQCPGLFQQFADICRNLSEMVNTVHNPLINHSGILRYPTGTVVFNCLLFGKGHQAGIYIIIFDYAPLMEGEILDDIVLTRREKEIIQVMAMGKTNKEISEILCIGLETVKSHIRNLFAKTGASSRVELIGKILQFPR